MRNKTLIDELDIDVQSLQAKKPQTEYKIQYIREYVLYWLKVSVNRDNIENINFIDCMCNAGIYQDGDFCTSVEVLQLFISEAKSHPQTNFYLYLNDYNAERIRISQKIICSFLTNENLNNIFVSYKTVDVNDYIEKHLLFEKSLKNAASNILFIDPYDMRKVKINSIRNFIKYFYCEVVFNVMTSDFTRNKNDKRIFELLGNKYEITTVDELMKFITNRLKIGKMKYCFSYSFNNLKNSEIYQILFLTPNIKGLEKLKEALRSVFKGMDKYKNKPNETQRELFTLEDSNAEENVLINCGKEAQLELQYYFAGKTVTYAEIEYFILERSVLAEHHIIKYILKPLINEKKVEKCNKTSQKSNFKQDEYKFNFCINK